MAIDAQPTPPNRLTQTQAEFDANASAIVDWMGDFADDLNAVSSNYLLGITTTSVTSNSIGTGSKSFTVQTGLGFVLGNNVTIANSVTNFMIGAVASYDSGTGALVVNVTDTGGSGTYNSWTISLAAVGANDAASVAFTPAGNVASTDVQAAIEELDSEKLSSSAGAVTGTNLEDIITGGTIGSNGVTPIITYDANGRITAVSSRGAWTYMSDQASTSGSAITFSAIPSWATEIEVMGQGVSSDGTTSMVSRLGDSGGIETSGYTGQNARQGSSGTVVLGNSASFIIQNNVAAATSYDFNIKYSKTGTTDKWGCVATCTAASGTSSSASQTNGYKTLSDTLTQLDITFGGDTFDGGIITVRYR